MRQFSKKEIEKRFKILYPDGEINLGRRPWWYCTTSNSRCINLYHCSTLYDIAEALQLAPPEEISAMKKAAGYVSYQ